MHRGHFKIEKGKESSAHEIINDKLHVGVFTKLASVVADELAYEAAEDDEGLNDVSDTCMNYYNC